MEHISAVQALAALAHNSRLAIFRCLVPAGPSGLTAGEIAKIVGIGPTALSFHIKELDRAGLVSSSKKGRFIRYALNVEGVRQLFSFLIDDCCGGHPEICGQTFEQASLLCRTRETCNE